MRRLAALGAIGLAALAVLAIPSTALATHDGTTCTYATDEPVNTEDATGNSTLVVYAGGPGMSGGATASAGACLNLGTPAADFEGGSGEAGAGISSDGLPGVYAIIDGDNDNVDPFGQSDGYIGVSNFETGPRGDLVSEALDCVSNGPDRPNNGGTNSGGCVGPDGGPVWLPVPLVACGNTSGNTWDATTRDGCSLP